MAKLYNLARVSTATTGTGTITLGAAVSGFLSFSAAGVSDQDIVRYAISDGANSEIGYGTYTASGTTLTRNVITSTNSNSAINLSGTAQVFITPAAQDFLVSPTAGGRLTLTSGTPVLTATTSAATTIYYTPYVNRFVPIYNGQSFEINDFGAELSQATTDTTKSPAACTTNSNYDLFVWNDSGTYRCTRGPAWTSSTARGTGAGTSQLQMIAGIWTNQVAITNGPAANRGTYVGTVRTNGSSQVDFVFGGSSSGGTAASIGVWNMYNRVTLNPYSADTVSSYTYQTDTLRQANSSSGNQISFIRGMDEDAVNSIANSTFSQSIATAVASIAIGLDSTSSNSGIIAFGIGAPTASCLCPASAIYTGYPGVGWHYLARLERSQPAGTCTWYGSVVNTLPSAITASLRG